MWMRKDSFGKISSIDLGFLMRLSRTTAFISTAKHLEVIVVNWGLQIGILPLSIPKETNKQRLLINS